MRFLLQGTLEFFRENHHWGFGKKCIPTFLALDGHFTARIVTQFIKKTNFTKYSQVSYHLLAPDALIKLYNKMKVWKLMQNKLLSMAPCYTFSVMPQATKLQHQIALHEQLSKVLLWTLPILSHNLFFVIAWKGDKRYLSQVITQKCFAQSKVLQYY